MKAILLTAAGTPEVLQMGQWPDPQLQGERELLVELWAAGVNPIDTKLRRRGTFYPDRTPAILGCDGAGIVKATGAQVQNFQVGDAVYFCNGGLGGTPGTYAEWTVVDERFCAPKPRSLSFAEAAAAPLVLITAWEALYDRGRLQPHQTVLIHAGAGGVGHVALQLAKLKGAQVCTTVSSPHKAEFARSLGADLALQYPHTNIIKDVLKWTHGTGVDLAFDTVGGPVLSRCFPVTRVGGDIVTLLRPIADTDWKTARTRNLRISFELMLTPMLQGLTTLQQHQADILRQCSQWFDAGQLQIKLSHTLPLRSATEAHHLLETGSMLGKVVLLIR